MPITPISFFSAFVRAYLLCFMSGYEFLTTHDTGMIRIATSNWFLFALFLFGFHQFPHFPFARVSILYWWLSVLLSVNAILASKIAFTMVRIELGIAYMAFSIHLIAPYSGISFNRPLHRRAIFFLPSLVLAITAFSLASCISGTLATASRIKVRSLARFTFCS